MSMRQGFISVFAVASIFVGCDGLAPDTELASSDVTGRYVVTYAAPAGGLPLNGDFAVTVEGKKTPVYRVLFNAEHAWHPPPYEFPTETGGMTYFDADGPVTAVVKLRNRTVSHARVVPSTLHVTPTVDTAAATVTVPLPGPGKYELQMDGEKSPLYLFVNQIEIDVPKQGDPGVLYYGPGVHSVGTVEIGGPGKKIVYVAGGAIVKGRFVSQGNDGVTIRGRGIIDNSEFPVRSGGPIHVADGDDIKIEDIILHDSSGWTLKLFHVRHVLVDNVKLIGQHRQNSDGIDVVNSQHIEVRNVFARVNDDVFVIKGFADADDCCSHPDTGRYSGARNSVSDVWFHDSIATTDMANGTLELGYELWGNEVRYVRYQNIVIPHSYSKSIIGIHAISTDMNIHDIHYDNIRAEDYHGNPNGKSWFSFDVRAGGTVSGISISDVRIAGGDAQHSDMKGVTASISDVTFSNIFYKGTKLTTLAALGFASIGDATNVRVLP